jgi:hypothetical protein
MTVRSGETYCGEHIDHVQTSTTAVRTLTFALNEQYFIKICFSFRLIQPLRMIKNYECHAHTTAVSKKILIQIKHKNPTNKIQFFSTCFKSHLQKHMARCNSKPTGSLPVYISPSINAGPVEDETPRVRLADVTDDELMSLIKKVDDAYQGNKIHP